MEAADPLDGIFLGGRYFLIRSMSITDGVQVYEAADTKLNGLCVFLLFPQLDQPIGTNPRAVRALYFMTTSSDEHLPVRYDHGRFANGDGYLVTNPTSELGLAALLRAVRSELAWAAPARRAAVWTPPNDTTSLVNEQGGSGPPFKAPASSRSYSRYKSPEVSREDAPPSSPAIITQSAASSSSPVVIMQPAAVASPASASRPISGLVSRLFGKSDANRTDPIEEAFQRLDRGWLGVDAPRQATVNRPLKVSAVAIRDRLRRSQVEAAMEHENPRLEEVPLGRLVRLELIADNRADFTIVPLSEAEQPVLRSELSRWEWSLTPLRCGPKQLLRLLATNCVAADGQSLRKSHPVRTIEIDVAVLPMADGQAAPPGLSGPELRRLLNRALPTDAEVEAFSLDYFPEIFGRFSQSMERTHKLTLLLALTTGTDLQRRLSDAHPHIVKQFLHGAEAQR